MKKNLLLVFGLLLFTVLARGQYVTIPDDNFRAFLKDKYPSCFNANDQMDTTCSTILNEHILSVPVQDITNLDGIAYFKSLWILLCANGQLSSIPRLPDSIFNFDCRGNLLTSLPELPPLLYDFYCQDNILTQLPPLPAGLRSVNCSDNKLTSLPGLPGKIVQLVCFNNNISCLPFLPNSLRSLTIDTTKTTCLTNAPDPDCVVYHPNGVRAYPQVCDNTNDPNSCHLNRSSISGQVFYDNNKNGTKDNDEPYKENIRVEIAGPGGTYTAYTDHTGHYTLIAETPGEYNFFVPKVPALFAAMPAVTLFNLSNPVSVSQDIALQPTMVKDSLAILFAQGTHICDDHFQGPFPPIVTFTDGGYCRIAYENTGTTTLSATLTITYDGNIIKIDSVLDNSAVINPGNIIVTENNFAAGSSKFIDCYFSSAKTGQEQCMPDIQMTATLAAGSTSASRPVFIETYALLPVKLVSFSAIAKPGNIAGLYWKSEEEENTMSFIVEQSIDGRKFTAVATIPAKGYGSNEYSINTPIPPAARVYFRLKVTGRDDKFSYSKIIQLKAINNKEGFTVLNNPVKGQLNITTKLASLVNSVAKIINSQGVIVKDFAVRPGLQNIDIKNLPTGIYFIQSSVDTKRIIIIK